MATGRCSVRALTDLLGAAGECRRRASGFDSSRFWARPAGTASARGRRGRRLRARAGSVVGITASGCAAPARTLTRVERCRGRKVNVYGSSATGAALPAHGASARCGGRARPARRVVVGVGTYLQTRGARVPTVRAFARGACANACGRPPHPWGAAGVSQPRLATPTAAAPPPTAIRHSAAAGLECAGRSCAGACKRAAHAASLGWILLLRA